MSKPPLLVFAYAFPHRKTQDFLLSLRLDGFHSVTVIAAPKVELVHSDPTSYFSTSLRRRSPADTERVCAALGFAFLPCEHGEVTAISDLVSQSGARIALISGARILKPAIIDLFSDGIINIHPGILPATSGLDAFYYTITKGVAAGATAHFIDGRVDAGEEILFEQTPIGPEDTPEIVAENSYQSQLIALHRVLQELQTGTIRRTPILRERKNQPMLPDEKRNAIARFASWRNAQYVRQLGEELVRACEAGDTTTAGAILEQMPALIEHRNEKGWSPLICASFKQHLETVKMLLAKGADPDGANANGTTPLMYAKTQSLHQAASDYPVLSALLAAGARLDRCDVSGCDIFHYVRAAGDEQMLAWLMARRER